VTPRHLKNIAAGMGVRGRQKAAFAMACAFTAVCLACYCVFFAIPRVSNLFDLNNEITVKRRILDIKKINYMQMEQNKAELEALMMSAGRDGALTSAEIPDAVLYIAEMMTDYAIADYNLVLSPGYEYGGNIFRQPVNASGAAASDNAYAFIEALENGAYRYEITELTIRTEPAGGVYLSVNLDILVVNQP